MYKRRRGEENCFKMKEREEKERGMTIGWTNERDRRGVMEK
jgi:hypothetical protein